MKIDKKILNEKDKILFEKALKFYFFARQSATKYLSKEVADRFQYSGSVAYSLIITFARTGSLKIEYMDFLNNELKILLSSEKNIFEKLQIKPTEIDDIQLMENTKIKVFDEDSNSNHEIIYTCSTQSVKILTSNN